MSDTPRSFQFLWRSMKLPRSLRTAHRLNLFLNAGKIGIFTPQELISEKYSLKTIKRLLKEYIGDDIVTMRILAYEVTPRGQEVCSVVESHPEFQKYIDSHIHEIGLSKPKITSLEN